MSDIGNHGQRVIRPAMIEDATLEDLDYLTELHLGAMMTLVKAALPAMKDAGFGRIVGISSRGALGLQTRTNYSATKAGINGFIRAAAIELARHGIEPARIVRHPALDEQLLARAGCVRARAVHAAARAAGFRAVVLGPTVLRAENAALACVAITQALAKR